MNTTDLHNLRATINIARAVHEDLTEVSSKYGTDSKEYRSQLSRSSGFIGRQLKDILPVYITTLEARLRDARNQTIEIVK